MRTYRSILKAKLREAGLTQKDIATRMGWATQGAVSYKLNGVRDWAEGELQRMCDLAGVTVAWLAENSDDLVITKNRKSATIASKADNLSESQRDLVLSLIESMNST
jgi:transcriptional regulator with XRE-family HTH domain